MGIFPARGMEGLWVIGNAEREPITGSGDGAPDRSRGIALSERVRMRSPLNLKALKQLYA